MEKFMEIYSEHLAKLFASENIAIEIKNSQTAYFDVKHRRMTFPTWILELPVASRELLMLHEASHALHTPEFGTHEAAKEYEQVFRTILNILEDKRIEDAMKEKFPGAKATFIRGFFELVNEKFFGIRFEDNVNSLNLLDRMNLHFKGDYYFECDFTEEEEYWVERAAKNKTFKEVYQNAIELYEWIKDEYSKEVLENIKYTFEDYKFTDDEYDGDGIPVEVEMEKIKNSMSEEDFEKLQEAIDTNDKEAAADIIKKNLENEKLDFSKNNAAKTDQNWEKNQENFSDLKNENNKNIYFTSYREPINVSLPRKINSDDFIVDVDYITKILANNMSHLSDKKREMFNTFVKEYKESMRPIMQHMLREFYRKKAAEDYRRTKQSKTGNLNLNKLPHFKYTSDLFLNKSVILDQKNHGFVLLIDWSGSMGYLMTSAILQLINNVVFCKSIDVPFVAYAFSSEASKSFDENLDFVFHAVEENDLRINPQFKLLEICNSTKGNYEEQLKHLFYLAWCFTTSIIRQKDYDKFLEDFTDELGNIKSNIGHSINYAKRMKEDSVVLSDLFDLGSTPLNDSLMLMNHILSEQKRKMNIDIMNFIIITDGDSDNMQCPAKKSVNVTTKIKRHDPILVPSITTENIEEDPLLLNAHDLQIKYNNNGDNSKNISNRSRRQKVFIKSLHSNKIYDASIVEDSANEYSYQINRLRTRSLAKILKQETGANIISIELVNTPNNAFKKSLVNSYNIKDFDEIEELASQYRKNGFTAISLTGYDKIFVVNTNVMGGVYNRNYYHDNFDNEDIDFLEELEVNKKGVFTTKQLTNALGKRVSQKNKKKFLATRIVDVVTEKQKIA